jgi:hypothetical protein
MWRPAQNFYRRSRADCSWVKGGEYASRSNCWGASSCTGGGGSTYGCDDDGNCVDGKGTFAQGACTCFDCATTTGGDGQCTSDQCSNPGAGPCYATNNVCYALSDGSCPPGTIPCGGGGGSSCQVVGNTGAYTQGCVGSDCTAKVCPVGSGGQTCGMHGSCDQSTGVCACASGWSGDACDTQLQCPVVSGSVCNDHGTCDTTTYTCNCTGGWSGVDCTAAPACPAVSGNTCNNHGTCNTSTWACECEDGWRGPACSITGSGPSPGAVGYPSVTSYWGQNWADPGFTKFLDMPWVGRVVISFALASSGSEIFQCNNNASVGTNFAWHGNYCDQYDCHGTLSPGGKDQGNNIMQCTTGKGTSYGTLSNTIDGTNTNDNQPFTPLAQAIPAVQAAGTEVIISLAGANGMLPVAQQGAEYGAQLLEAMRTQFLDIGSGTVRPFGTDVVLDGVDLDLEVIPDGPWFLGFLNAWNKEKMGKRSGGKGMMLTSAPEAALKPIWKNLFATNGDGSLVNLPQVAQIDVFQLQFYNTPFACWACTANTGVTDNTNPTGDGYMGMGSFGTHWNTPGACAPCPYASNKGFSIGGGGTTCMAGNLISYLQLFDSICMQCNTWRKANGYTQLQKFQVGIPAPPTINSLSRATDSAGMGGLFAAMLDKPAAERVTYWTTEFNTAAQQLASIFPLHFGGFMEWDAAGDTGPYFVAAPGTLQSNDRKVEPWTGGTQATIGSDVQLSGLMASAVEAQLGAMPTTMDDWSAKLAGLTHDAKFNPGGTC